MTKENEQTNPTAAGDDATTPSASRAKQKEKAPTKVKPASAQVVQRGGFKFKVKG